MLLCVFCRVLAAPSSLSQPKPFHGPKNMSLAASTISSAISSQSRYICKPLFFEPNRFWFCIMLFDMRFSVSEGIDLAEKKELPLPYLLCDNPARKHVNVGYVTTRSSWNRSVSPGWFVLLLPSWNENICLETLGENDGPFFFLVKTGWQECFITRKRECCFTASLPSLFTAFITLWQLTEEKAVDCKTHLNTVFRNSEKLNQQYIWDCNYPCVFYIKK